MKAFLGLIYILLVLGAMVGWVKNIYALTQCDFEPTYKAEVLRIIGIPIAPVGAILGYVDLGK